MPRNGSGTFSLVAGNPVVTGTVISSTDFNNTMTDLGTALSGSLASDGQTAWAGNQNANGNRLTSLSLPAASTDAGTAGDMQNGRLTYLTAVAGANTITASLALLAAYTTGEVFRFVAANTNTGAVTLNVNSLGALAITKFGTVALVPGDIRAGQVVTVAYDGTRFQLQSGSTGLLIGVRVISASATYTPTPGTNAVQVLLQGGGGAGGGTLATGAAQQACGGGGGAGGWAMSFMTAGFAGVTIIVGAAGVAVSGASGGNGGSSSFGGIFAATGGVGGGVGSALSNTLTAFAQGSGGGTGSGGNVLNAIGGSGGIGLYTPTGGVLSGNGGMGYFGQGGGSVTAAANGVTAATIGAGGGGAAQTASGGALQGGGGASGVAIIWEYA